MKWDSLTGPVRFVVGQYLKERDLEQDSVMGQTTPQKSALNVSSWLTALHSENHPTFILISVWVVLTLPNSTTWKLSTLIKKYNKGGKMKLMQPIETVQQSIAIAADSTAPKTLEAETPYVEEDKWSKYEK